MWRHKVQVSWQILLGMCQYVFGDLRYFNTDNYQNLHEINNDNGFRMGNFATQNILVVKYTSFPHDKIHKYTWNSSDGKKAHNPIDHSWIDNRLYLVSDLLKRLTVVLTSI